MKFSRLFINTAIDRGEKRWIRAKNCFNSFSARADVKLEIICAPDDELKIGVEKPLKRFIDFESCCSPRSIAVLMRKFPLHPSECRYRLVFDARLLIESLGAARFGGNMRIVLALTTMLFLSAFVSAQSARTNQDTQGQIVNRRIVDLPVLKPNVRPKLTLQRALKLAEDYIEKEKIDISSYYLLEARLIHYGSEKSVKEPRWFFLWVHESGAIGNHVEITVSMEGKVARHPSM